MNDMIYVYLIPQKRSNGYCFGGPIPVTFGNVDWMGPVEPSMTRDDLERFISRKGYFTAADPGTRFLVLCDARPELTFQLVRGGSYDQ